MASLEKCQNHFPYDLQEIPKWQMRSVETISQVCRRGISSRIYTASLFMGRRTEEPRAYDIEGYSTLVLAVALQAKRLTFR